MRGLALSTFLAIGVGCPLSAQDFFDSDAIHTVQIQFSDPNWDHLLDSMAQAYIGSGTGEGRLLGTVTIDGETYDSCGVRYKGNTSYDPLSNKNPLNIDLNAVIGGQDHQGIDKIKLANGANDPSLLREVTFYEIVRNYMHAPRASYVKVWINGDYKGLYVNTEDIGNEFLDAHFGSSDGVLFKCDPRNFVLYGDNSNLAWYPDSTAYDTLYDMQSAFGLEALQELTYELEFDAGNIADHLDVDRVLWYHALSNVFVHLDSYYAFAHNYYMYQDKNQRWDPIMWDVNMSFGGLIFDGFLPFPLGTDQLASINPFHLALSFDYRPLIGRILLQSTYAKAYMAHYRTILEEMVYNDAYFDRAQHYHQLIDSIVAYEPYPFYPYAEFQQNLTDDVGSFLTLRPGIQSMMEARMAHLDTLAGMFASQPVISNETTFPAVPAPMSLATITADVSDAITVFLGTRVSRFDRFNYQLMYDDGAHNDGAAGDGTYGALVLLGMADLQYFIYAENDSVGRFSPPRAEHEWHTLALAPGLALNEAQAANSATWADEAGEYDDWVELFNNGSSPVDLSGFHLSDAADNPTKWALPDTSIAPNGFLIIWADEDSAQGPMHANFKLAATGEPLLLTDASGNLVDDVQLTPVPTDATFGRYPNGTGPWAQLVPTWSTSNSGAIDVQETVSKAGGGLYPVPSTGMLTLVMDDPKGTLLKVFNGNGALVREQRISSVLTTVDLRGEPDGVYLIRAGALTWRAVLMR